MTLTHLNHNSCPNQGIWALTDLVETTPGAWLEGQVGSSRRLEPTYVEGPFPEGFPDGNQTSLAPGVMDVVGPGTRPKAKCACGHFMTRQSGKLMHRDIDFQFIKSDAHWIGEKVQDKSYRLAQYEIILKGNGEIWWRAHAGFAGVKSGKCFIEGKVLFIGPSEMEETGSLKNEFLNYLKQFAPWDGTKYYCPSYTLYACLGGRVQHDVQRKTTKGVMGHNRNESSAVDHADKEAFSRFSPINRYRQMKGKLAEAYNRCKQLAEQNLESVDPEE